MVSSDYLPTRRRSPYTQKVLLAKFLTENEKLIALLQSFQVNGTIRESLVISDLYCTALYVMEPRTVLLLVAAADFYVTNIIKYFLFPATLVYSRARVLVLMRLIPFSKAIFDLVSVLHDVYECQKKLPHQSVMHSEAVVSSQQASVWVEFTPYNKVGENVL